MKPLILLLAASLALPAVAGERDRSFDDRPSVGEPVRFLGADGGSFQPRTLVIVSPSGTVRAALPATTDDARAEDRIDLSSLPLVGGVFRGTLSTSNARQGLRVGDLFQAPGGVLVLRTPDAAATLTGLPVVLAANLPRLGGVSYPLSRLTYSDTGGSAPTGAAVGSAHVVDGRLVLASEGGPAYPSVEALFKDVFQ